MPAVLACYRPTVSEGWRERSRAPRSSRNGALGPAAALEHETAVPIGRRRQAQFEPIAIRKTVDADTLIDDTLHLAVIRKRHAVGCCGAARVPPGERDLRRRDWKRSEVCKICARRRWIGSIVLDKARAQTHQG